MIRTFIKVIITVSAYSSLQVKATGLYNLFLIVENIRWQQFGTRYANTIQSIRSINSRRDSIAAEQRHNFGKRRRGSSSASSTPSGQAKFPRLQTWTHRFVCLPKANNDRIPSTVVEQNEIIQAGLWEKKISIPDIDCGTKNFMKSFWRHSQDFKQEVGLNS